MNRRDMMKSVLGAVGGFFISLMPWRRAEADTAKYQALDPDFVGPTGLNKYIDYDIHIGATSEETLNNIVSAFGMAKEKGYTEVLPADDVVRLRLGWIFGKRLRMKVGEDVKEQRHLIVNGLSVGEGSNWRLVAEGQIMHATIPISAFKGYDRGTDKERLLSQALETDEGRLALLEAIKGVAGWYKD